MPQQFHNIEVDNLWKIKRKVAKIMRANNDDDRGLTETKDMSEDADLLIKRLGELKNLIYDVNTKLSFLDEDEAKLEPDKKLSTIMNTIDDVERIIKKVDFNKMNADNIQKIQSLVDELTNQSADFFSDIKDGVIYRSTIDLEDDEIENVTDDIDRQFASWDKIFKETMGIVAQINLKMSFYKKTIPTFSEPAISGGRMIGGCNCNSTSLKYRPEYQTPEYY